jgi:hypothetical protein
LGGLVFHPLEAHPRCTFRQARLCERSKWSPRRVLPTLLVLERDAI